jgi:DNA polymerase elongation subunit (family B)
VENIVHYIYNGNDIEFIDTEGRIFRKTTKELGYPHFWGIPDKNKKFTDEELSKIAYAKKKHIQYISPDGLKDADVYEVGTFRPADIRSIREKFVTTFEASLPYIRRLSFDKVVNWAEKVDRYADIDIEERNGKIEVIGYKDSVTNEYEALHSIKELTDILEKRKISEIYAWNGASYDYERIEQEVKNPYYKYVLKLDAMFLYSIFTQKTSPRTLNKAGMEVGIGEKVKISKPFQKLSQEELEAYNRQDVELLRGIMNKTGIRDLMHYYSYSFGLHPNEIYSSSKTNFTLRPSASRIFDSLIIRSTPRYYLLDVPERKEKTPYQGGFVLEPEKGLYEKVAVFDYNSLYPHVVLYSDYNNYVYNLVKQYEEKVYNERVEFRKKYKETGIEEYNHAQASLKIVINSLYGLFANPYFRYYDVGVASHITATAREMIKKMMAVVQNYGYRVIAGDTDSIFCDNVQKEEAENLVKNINQAVAPYEVKLEKWYPRMLIFGE